MSDSVKYYGGVLYALVAVVYMFMDWFANYGDDGLLFWVILRPFVSFIKGALWPLMLLF
jgi:hypothetical protein